MRQTSNSRKKHGGKEATGSGMDGVSAEWRKRNARISKRDAKEKTTKIKFENHLLTKTKKQI